MRPALFIAPLAIATVAPTMMLALLVAALLAAFLASRLAAPIAPTLAPLATVAMPACTPSLVAVAIGRSLGAWPAGGGGGDRRCSVLILSGGTMRARLAATLSATSATALARLAVVGAVPARPPDLHRLGFAFGFGFDLSLRLDRNQRLGWCLFRLNLVGRGNIRDDINSICRRRRWSRHCWLAHRLGGCGFRGCGRHG